MTMHNDRKDAATIGLCAGAQEQSVGLGPKLEDCTERLFFFNF